MWLFNWFKKRNHQRAASEARLKILVLTMSIDDRILLRRLAKEYSWEVCFTYSPEDAFNRASQSYFEIILCDRNQPGYPWREVMDRLAACSPRSCILFVSPVSDDDLWRNVLQQGGYDVLIRPLREEAVLRAVQAVVRFISRESDVSVGCR